MGYEDSEEETICIDPDMESGNYVSSVRNIACSLIFFLFLHHEEDYFEFHMFVISFI